MNDLYRVCVKVYATPSSTIDDALFVTLFHEWIRDRVLDLTLIDVSDYTHAPDSPGVMLVAHEATFALDRSDGSFGLLVQYRRPAPHGTDSIEHALQLALDVAERIERDPRLHGKLAFDRSRVRIEANDRLLAPNDAASYEEFSSRIRPAAEATFSAAVHLRRVDDDPRNRLAIEVSVA